MASPKEIVPLLPETLPEDFSDWDGEGSAAPLSGNTGEWDALETPHSFGNSPKPFGQSTDRDAILESLADRSSVSGSTSSAPAYVKQQIDLGDWESEAPRKAKPKPTSTPTPVSQNEWEAFETPHSLGKSPKPIGQSMDRAAIFPPAVNRPPAPSATSPASVLAQQQRDSSTRDREVSSVPAPATVNRDEWEALEAPRALDKFPKTPGQSANQEAILPPVVQRPAASSSGAPAPVVVKKQDSVNDRNHEASAAPATVNRDEWEALESPRILGNSQKPLGKSAEREAILPPPVIHRPRVSGSTAPAPVSLGSQKSTSALVDVLPSRASHASDGGYTLHDVPVAPSRPNTATVGGALNAPELTASASHEADAGLFQSFQSTDEVVKEQKIAKKKWMIIATASICSILFLLTLISLALQHRTKSAETQTVEPSPAASDTQPETDTPAPAASVPLTQDKPRASTEITPATTSQPANKEDNVDPAQAQKDMMHDQLTAPTQIPQDVKKRVADNGPPPDSFGAAGADGMGGSGVSGSIFNGEGKPNVQLVKPLPISAGIATGLLIQRSQLVYPAIARSARVSGTVEIEATISKTGTITDLYAVSGPAMLRQAAVDAVRTWRYKPYKLNNEPIEVQAKINVVFDLGQ